MVNPTLANCGCSTRNCLENPHGLHLEVPEVGKTRGEAPSLPLCTTKNTCSRPVKLFSKQFLEGKFSETGLPRRGVLGNSEEIRRPEPRIAPALSVTLNRNVEGYTQDVEY